MNSYISSPEKKKYFMGHAVVIIKEFSPLGLSKVKYFDETEELIVDSKLISNFPIEEKTISFQLLGGYVNDTQCD
ncbi:hypothetical protein PT249_02150 [Erysipelothrix rhusiopathiae]|nr:hypothetical protein [Erysipelothrix rhusiopathiae]